VLPTGRLLLAVGWASGGKYPDTDVDFFEQYRWLELPSMTVSPHPLLTGDYPIWDDFLTVTLSPNLAHLAFARYTWSKIEIAGKTYDATTSYSVLLADPEGDKAIPISQPITDGRVNLVMGCGDDPSWSANSQFFAFARTPNWTGFESERHLYLYDVASGQLQTVTIHSQGGVGAFALSPGGAQIAFTALESDPEIGLNIHLMNADGSNDRVRVRGWVSSNLVWDADGKRIFFKTDRMNDVAEPGIYSVDVATGATTLVTVVSEHAWCLRLSPDESLLTYSDDPGIMVVSPQGGEPRELLTGECKVRHVSRQVWSPDNQYFAFVGGPIPDTQIFIMDRAGNCKALDYHEDKLVPWHLIGWLP
jgi:dipeptidyl aminopeptidase/acylaminoacyl peptidase